MKRSFLLRRIQNVAAVLSIAFSIMSCSEAEDSSTVPELFQIHSQTSAYQSDGIKEGMLLRDFSRNIKCVNPQFIEGFDYVKGYEYLLYAEKVVDYIPEGYEYHAYTLKEVKLKASNWDVKTDCIVDGKLFPMEFKALVRAA